MTLSQVMEHAKRNGLPLPTALDATIAPRPIAEPDDFREPDDAYAGPEKKLHALFIADMNRRGAHCIHAFTHTKSTIEPGLPDVHVLFVNPETGEHRTCAVEFKAANGNVKDCQKEKIKEMRGKRIPVLVAWNLKAAIDFAKEQLFGDVRKATPDDLGIPELKQ